MLNYEEEMNVDSRRLNKPMQFHDNDSDDAFEIANASVEDWEKQIDANVCG